MTRRSFLAAMSALCVPLTGHGAPVPSGATASGRRHFRDVRIGDTFAWGDQRYRKVAHHDAQVNARMLGGPRAAEHGAAGGDRLSPVRPVLQMESDMRFGFTRFLRVFLPLLVLTSLTSLTTSAGPIRDRIQQRRDARSATTPAAQSDPYRLATEQAFDQAVSRGWMVAVTVGAGADPFAWSYWSHYSAPSGFRGLADGPYTVTTVGGKVTYTPYTVAPATSAPTVTYGPAASAAASGCANGSCAPTVRRGLFR